jgi:hypothetical protein
MKKSALEAFPISGLRIVAVRRRADLPVVRALQGLASG